MSWTLHVENKKTQKIHSAAQFERPMNDVCQRICNSVMAELELAELTEYHSEFKHGRETGAGTVNIYHMQSLDSQYISFLHVAEIVTGGQRGFFFQRTSQ